jgi:RNA polymerase sigma-70 factor (ECF subfamily)
MENQPDAAGSAGFIRRLQEGDEVAYGELLERWRRPVLNFVYRLTGDASAADEIAQEVFVRVSRKVGEYRHRGGGETAFSSWLFQIARNAALDARRHRRRHPADSLEEQPAAGARIADSAPCPARAAELRDTGAEIAAAVLALPEEQRTALVLAEYHDFAVAEIAAVMGTNAKSVEARLYRARQTLRQKLAHLMK